MKNVLLGLTFAVSLSLPAAAQQMGRINLDAPKVTTGIEFADGTKLSVTYKAINFGEGKFEENMKKESFRTMLNENAKQHPCGSISLNKGMTFSSGFQVPAGEYGLHFMISDRGTWVAALSTTSEEGDLQLKQFPLRLAEMDVPAQRLSIQLAAADKANQCTLALQFGSKGLKVTGSVAAEKDGDGEGEGEAKKK